jgi:FlaA1/EpsC-like NDP-sugar epimerase
MLRRSVLKGLQVLVDFFALSVAYGVAFESRYEFNLDFQTYKLLFFTWPYVVILQYVNLSLFGVPAFSWRYVSIKEAKRIFSAIGAASALLVVLRLIGARLGGYFLFVTIPLGVLLIDFFLALMGITGVRVVRRLHAEREERSRIRSSVVKKRTLLIGAGRAGVLTAKEVEQNPHLDIAIAGFIDDDPLKMGQVIQGIKVVGRTNNLSDIADKYNAEQAVITIAAVHGSEIRRIVSICKAIPLPVKIIPGIYEILGGKVSLSRIREVTIEDLLCRDAVDLDTEAVGRFLQGKRVLITGAGGSIGSEISRQVGRFQPASLVLLEQAENSLFCIHQELIKDMADIEILPCICDICDAKRVQMLFSKFQPQVIFHAAAHKHVPMMEWNPGEAIKNNVFGTKIVADAADYHGAEAFVMISTDKAVNPSSIMGASKRAAEIYVQTIAERSNTKFVAVRFGNVLGSAGSVIPTFKEQIRRGGPVTVTHPEMKRYFMTIPEACQLVMQAATMGRGAEIFVLDMGEPVKIVDLARDLIRLSGFSENEIRIAFTGVRPGEKLFEEISTTDEHMTKTRHPKIFIGKISAHPYEQVMSGLELLERVTECSDRETVCNALRNLVSEMREPEPAFTTDPNLSPIESESQQRLLEPSG